MKITNNKLFSIFVRQGCLASVTIVALSQGLNGIVILTYMVTVSLMAGVDAKEIKEVIT